MGCFLWRPFSQPWPLAVAGSTDIDKSGWWQLLNFLPVIGWIVLLDWAVQEGREPNRF